MSVAKWDGISDYSVFDGARAIWPTGRETEMNRFVGFRVVLPTAQLEVASLFIVASSSYRLFVNGKRVGHGPARGPHGRFRTDGWSIGEFASGVETVIAIEAVGYNVNSYYLLDQPAFLVAEVYCPSTRTVLASTAGKGLHFEALLLDDHVQRVERYSVARTFSEALRLRPGVYDWRGDPGAAFTAETCTSSECPPLLTRRTKHALGDCIAPKHLVRTGAVESAEPPDPLYRDWSLTGLGTDLKGYAEDELETAPGFEWQALRIQPDAPTHTPAPDSLELDERRAALLDFGANQTGFLRLTLRCTEPTRLFLAFDEILTDGVVDPRRLRCLNIIEISAAAGMYEIDTFEPYTLRYLEVLALEGRAEVAGVELRKEEHPLANKGSVRTNDPAVEALFKACRRTFRQNATDILMDCPSRERAGWACDSFFTARAEHLFTGRCDVETAFLENYLLAPEMASIPSGMLPMNYPADHPNGDFLGERDAQFIPQWALWLVLQLEEYATRGDERLAMAFEPKVSALFDYLSRFENTDGLLESLDGWLFLEWSGANEATAGVNYPTNVLYAAALDAAGRLFKRRGWSAQAAAVRATILDQSFDGRWFADQAIRGDGELIITEHRTELCQTFAFYFGLATPSTHPELWEEFVQHLGPTRDAATILPEVAPAALLIGWMLRFELLAKHGWSKRSLTEMLHVFGPMVEATGTLWEHARPSASCCHGFASHAAVILKQAIQTSR